MTVQVELSPEVEIKVAVKAAQKGLAVPDYLKSVIEEDVTPITSSQPDEESSRNLAALEVLRAWRAQNATDDPAELDRRRQDWQEFKTALNDSHTSDRILFP